MAGASRLGGAARGVLATGLPACRLLILDINLPDDSGWSLLRDGSLTAAGSPPVVIMSGTQIRPSGCASSAWPATCPSRCR